MRQVEVRQPAYRDPCTPPHPQVEVRKAESAAG
jgi:hypothetical protein